jgi:hypothetical protein
MVGCTPSIGRDLLNTVQHEGAANVDKSPQTWNPRLDPENGRQPLVEKDFSPTKEGWK